LTDKFYLEADVCGQCVLFFCTDRGYEEIVVVRDSRVIIERKEDVQTLRWKRRVETVWSTDTKRQAPLTERATPHLSRHQDQTSSPLLGGKLADHLEFESQLDETLPLPVFHMAEKRRMQWLRLHMFVAGGIE
jgi:hypothetical protein